MPNRKSISNAPPRTNDMNIACNWMTLRLAQNTPKTQTNAKNVHDYIQTEYAIQTVDPINATIHMFAINCSIAFAMIWMFLDSGNGLYWSFDVFTLDWILNRCTMMMMMMMTGNCDCCVILIESNNDGWWRIDAPCWCETGIETNYTRWCRWPFDLSHWRYST